MRLHLLLFWLLAGGLPHVGERLIITSTAAWRNARPFDSKYLAISRSSFVSDDRRGQEAEVIAVQGAGARDSEPMDIVVRFDDGAIAITTGTALETAEFLPITRGFTTLAEIEAEKAAIEAKKAADDAALHAEAEERRRNAEAVAKQEAEIAKKIEPIVLGKNLYAVASSNPAAENRNFPLLTPLKVLRLAVDLEVDIVRLTLQLPDGKLETTPVRIAHLSADQPPTLTQLAGTLLTRIPPDLTPAEIDAIKKHALFIGMSRKAVEYAFGKPEEINDYGRGGIQLIYAGGRFLVYLDSAGKVFDRQILGIRPQ